MKKTKAEIKRTTGRILVVLALLVFGAVGNLGPAKGAEYHCKSSSCPFDAACWGDVWSGNGCDIQCWANDNGHITPLGSAGCGQHEPELE
jgi:hypothetical protein